MPTTTAVQVSATGTIVAARAGYAVRVLGWAISFSGTTNVKWQSHATPTDLTGLFYGGANINYSSPSLGMDANRGHFQTLIGEALDLNLSAGVAVGGYVVTEYVAQ